MGLIARRVDALPGFAFALQRADLDDPSGVGGDGLDGAVLLNGLRLRRGSGIGIGHRLRGGAAGTLDAGNTPSTPFPVP